MKKLKRIASFVAIVAAVLMLGSCGKISDIRPTSFEIQSLRPNGFRAVDAIVTVGIHNPFMKFRVEDGTGVVYDKGMELCTLNILPFEVEKKDDVYSLDCTLKLSDDVSLLTVMSLATNYNPDDITIDASATVRAIGLNKKIVRKGIPLSKLMEKK